MPDRPAEGSRPEAQPLTADDPRAALGQAGVIHDVNQMLAVILGRAELLQQRQGEEGNRRDLEAIALAARDAAAMLQRLRRGLPAAGIRGRPVSTRLADAVAAVALLIRPPEGEQWLTPDEPPTDGGWVLDLAVPGNLYTAVPAQVLREVLSNLVLNALEVMPGGGRLEIDALGEESRVLVTVSDSGPGLDKARAERIFEVGFTTRQGDFRGIGLAGSRQLLKCFDGRLDLAPHQGRGASFQLDLPAASPPARGSEPGVLPAGESPRPRSLPILVVDDEAAVRDMLTDVLAELGCRVATARDAGSALDLFAPGDYRLALVDQSLPGKSGLELAAELRVQDPDLVVVLVSGWGQEELLAGADPAVVDLTATKPLDLVRLKEILELGADLADRRAAGNRKRTED